MKNNIWVAMAVFAILATASFAITISSWTTDKSSYEPGDSGYITVSVSMTTGLSTGDTLSGFKSVTVDSYSSFTDYSQNLGSMGQGSTVVTVPFKIGQGTPEGIYTVSVDVSGVADVQKADGSKESKMDSGVAAAVVKVVSRPLITLDIAQKNIGKKGTMNITVCAKKGSPKSIQITSQLYLDGGKIYIDRLGNCTTVSSGYDASGLAAGSSNVAFNLSYSDAIGGAYSETVYVPMSISKDISRFTISQSGAITHKKAGSLSITVENKGEPAEDVRVVPGSGITLTRSSEMDMGDIGTGQNASFSDIAYTTMDPGINAVGFTVYWKENGQDKSDEIIVPIDVESEDSIEIYMEANPSPLTAGGEHTISVIVANKASYSMYGVSVGVDSSAFDVLDVEKRKFIGSINNDDFSSQQFKVRISSSPPGDSSVNITVNFKDPSGMDHTKTTSVPINIKAAERGGDNGLLLFGGIAVVLIAAYLLLKRRKDAKK